MKKLSRLQQATLIEQVDRCVTDRETTTYYLNQADEILDQIFDFAEVNGYEDTKLWNDLQELGLKITEAKMINGEVI